MQKNFRQKKLCIMGAALLLCVLLGGCARRQLAERTLVRAVFVQQEDEGVRITALYGTDTENLQQKSAEGSDVQQAFAAFEKAMGPHAYFGVQDRVFVHSRLTRGQLRQFAQLLFQYASFLPQISAAAFEQPPADAAAYRELYQSEEEYGGSFLRFLNEQDLILPVAGGDELCAVGFEETQNVSYTGPQAAAALVMAGNTRHVYYTGSDGRQQEWRNARAAVTLERQDGAVQWRLYLFGSVQNSEKQADDSQRQELTQAAATLLARQCVNAHSAFGTLRAASQYHWRTAGRLLQKDPPALQVTATWENG